jgi:capsular exopolysaccharide synthesis family protein
MGKYHTAVLQSGRSKKLTPLANTIRTLGRGPRLKSSCAPPAAQAASPAPPAAPSLPASPASPAPPESVRADEIDPLVVTYHRPVSVEAEIFKILRTNILFPKNGAPPPRTILVTSAIPGDGKSFVAANLAVSMAQGVQEHVMLMDCDMRRSTIHKRFGLHDDVLGLSDYLSGQHPLESLLKKTAVDKLTILPSGPPPPNPSELLSSPAMRALLAEVRDRYPDRYIILDSPPPQLTAETTALAQYVDGIILVVKYASTPKALLAELVEKLGQEKIIGVVMNSYRVPMTERYKYGKYTKYA